jgi:hypothetical protein
VVTPALIASRSVISVVYVIGKINDATGGGIENCALKTIEAVSYVAAASPLLFDFLQPSGVGSSGIALVGFGFRLSYRPLAESLSRLQQQKHYGKP